jgi:hypothetical protein
MTFVGAEAPSQHGRVLVLGKVDDIQEVVGNLNPFQ